MTGSWGAVGLAEQALLEARQELARLRSAAAASGSDADALAQKSARGFRTVRSVFCLSGGSASHYWVCSYVEMVA